MSNRTEHTLEGMVMYTRVGGIDPPRQSWPAPIRCAYHQGDASGGYWVGSLITGMQDVGTVPSE
jgi:hypothetical protein